MNYRVINTAIHLDEWFRDLTVEQRMVWFYLLTAPESNLSGIFQIDLRYMELNTGIPLKEIKETFELFQKDNRMSFKSNYVILIKFLKHQQLNHNQIKRVYKIITEQIPADVRDHIRNLNHFRLTINGLDKYESLQEWLSNHSKPLANHSKPLHNHNDKEKGKEKRQRQEKLESEKEKERQAKGSAEGKSSAAAADASLNYEEIADRYDFLKVLKAEGMGQKKITNLVEKYGIKHLFMVYQHIYSRPAENWIGLFLNVVKSDEEIPITAETRKMAENYRLEI